MKIDMHYAMQPEFGPLIHEESGLGGTENFITYLSEELTKDNHDVRVYNLIIESKLSFNGVPWKNVSKFDLNESRDILISFRTRDVFDMRPNAKLKVIILADTESHGLGDAVRSGLIDLVMFVSKWQAEKIMQEEGLKDSQCMVASNGIRFELFDLIRGSVRRQSNQCIHYATPERGLEPLLDMWPTIQEQVPDAQLVLYSSFMGWRVTAEQNEQMCKDIYNRIEQEQEKSMNIFNGVHTDAPTIRRQLFRSALYLYPSRNFNETCCISALEASAAGTPIVTSSRAAMVERVDDGKTGYLIPNGSNHDEQFINAVVGLLNDPVTLMNMSKASIEKARPYGYVSLVKNWLPLWEARL